VRRGNLGQREVVKYNRRRRKNDIGKAVVNCGSRKGENKGGGRVTVL